MIVSIIEQIYALLWGDLITIPLPGGGSLGISLLVILLIPTGVYFTIRTKFLPIRLFPDMVRALLAKKEHKDSLSTFQTLIVSTATRVGMGNLVGVVAAVSAGGAGAVFWMWVTALIGSSTAFIEATLAQLHKEKDPLYGGYRGGPAYYIHHYFEDKFGKKKRYVLISVLFAISGLICWCGISQVISNSVAASFENAFHIKPLYTTIVLVVIAAFSVTIIVVYFLRRLSVNYAWTIAMIAGAMVNIVILLMGDLLYDINISVFGILAGSILALLVAKVIEFFRFCVDYSRTEKVQYEDDEYYYYVKAVPKMTVTAPTNTVKRINTQYGVEGERSYTTEHIRGNRGTSVDKGRGYVDNDYLGGKSVTVGNVYRDEDRYQDDDMTDLADAEEFDDYEELF